MADDYSVGEAPAKARGIMSKRVFGVPIIYLAVIPVIALAFYAWRTKDTSAEAAADATDPDPTGEGEGLDTSGLYPISPTGTVYAQSPTQTVEDTAYFGNNDWLRKVVTGMVKEGKNGGEIQIALQAYLAGDHLSYQQSLIRDEAIKDYGIPPESFTAGGNDGKPAPVPTVTNTPAPAPPPPVIVDTPRPVAAAPTPATVTRTHKVRRGDTLWDLAGKYYGHYYRWTDIANRNGIRNPKALKVGQILVIP